MENYLLEGVQYDTPEKHLLYAVMECALRDATSKNKSEASHGFSRGPKHKRAALEWIFSNDRARWGASLLTFLDACDILDINPESFRALLKEEECTIGEDSGEGRCQGEGQELG